LLFELRQDRYQRLAAAGEGLLPLVELSIDHIHYDAAIPHDLLGVEVELLPTGDPLSLEAIADELQHVWGLIPEPISKFERGLAQARPELLSLIHAR
jgi:inorganic triphosphatase YgiF